MSDNLARSSLPIPDVQHSGLIAFDADPTTAIRVAAWGRDVENGE